MSEFERITGENDPGLQAKLDALGKDLIDPGMDIDPELRQVFKDLHFLVDNPKKTIPPII